MKKKVHYTFKCENDGKGGSEMKGYAVCNGWKSLADCWFQNVTCKNCRSWTLKQAKESIETNLGVKISLKEIKREPR